MLALKYAKGLNYDDVIEVLPLKSDGDGPLSRCNMRGCLEITTLSSRHLGMEFLKSSAKLSDLYARTS